MISLKAAKGLVKYLIPSAAQIRGIENCVISECSPILYVINRQIVIDVFAKVECIQYIWKQFLSVQLSAKTYKTENVLSA